MNRKPTGTPIDPWQWFSGVIYHLGKSSVLKIWNVAERTLERWSADKDFTESVTKNPLVKLEITLEKLMERGKVEFARSAVDSLARIVGCTLREINLVSDKKTIEEELLDNIPALARYQEIARPSAKRPVAEIRAAAQALVREIEEDVALIEQQRGEEK